MTNPAWIDAHCHLADPRFEPIRDEAIRRAAGRGVQGFIQGGYDPEDWHRQSLLQARLPNRIFPAFGLHPWWVAQQAQTEAWQERDFAPALQLLSDSISQAVALGETGLDHLKRFAPHTHSIQLSLFRAQIEISQKARKPLILHVVRAHKVALEALNELKPAAGGIVHFFSGSWQDARKYLDHGFLISLGRGFHAEIATQCPGSHLVIESDCPDHGPAPGVLSEPTSILEIASEVAPLRKETAEEILRRSTENLRRDFHLRSIF